MPLPLVTEEYDLKIKILSQKYNPLLKRKEVVFEVDHSQEGHTSSRLELRKNLANTLKTKIDLVFVEKVETKTGTMTATGEANAYESPEQAKLIEHEHLITRNIPPKKPEEPEKPKTETAEKPAERETKELKNTDKPEKVEKEGEKKEE